jgi:hypothetical protein
VSAISEVTGATVTVVIPLQVKRRNGRPRIVLPDDHAHQPAIGSDRPGGAVVRAIAQAWGWRRRLEAGEVLTLQDVADHEKVTVSYVSRRIRLAYLSPEVLERIVTASAPVALSLDELGTLALEPWAAQIKRMVYGQG